MLRDFPKTSFQVNYNNLTLSVPQTLKSSIN